MLTLSAAAEDLWLDFSQEVEDQLIEGGALDAVRDWGSKLPGAVARVAALLELAEMGLQTEEVSHGAMDRAIRLARLMVPHAQAAFGLLGADVADVDANALSELGPGEPADRVHHARGQKAQDSRFKTAAKLQRRWTN